MKFAKGLLVFLLVAIIVGGVGYIGYSLLFMDHSGHNMPGMASSQPDQSTASANSGSVQNQQNSSTSQNQQNNGVQQSGNSQVALDQANPAIQNKDKLGKSIATLNETLRLLTVDPYAPSTNVQQQQTAAQAANTAGAGNQSGSAAQGATQGNSTTINIYPQNGSSAAQTGSIPQTPEMQNMGTTYDANKMEQLHNGLYKISLGMALLNQLNNDLITQAGYANVNYQNTVQYYSNQYYATVQNSNKLNQALTYINEAANLVNINPYVSSNGLVYDKDRMNQLHQSVFKLAEGVASLNQLNDDFTNQSIYLSNTVQNLINNANNNMNNMQMNMPSGLFGNINMSTVLNIILIIFVIGLIFGIFGFIFSMLKSSGRKPAGKEDGMDQSHYGSGINDYKL